MRIAKYCNLEQNQKKKSCYYPFRTFNSSYKVIIYPCLSWNLSGPASLGFRSSYRDFKGLVHH